MSDGIMPWLIVGSVIIFGVWFFYKVEKRIKAEKAIIEKERQLKEKKRAAKVPTREALIILRALFGNIPAGRPVRINIGRLEKVPFDEKALRN